MALGNKKYIEFMHFDGQKMSTEFSGEKAKIEIFHNKKWIEVLRASQRLMPLEDKIYDSMKA